MSNNNPNAFGEKDLIDRKAGRMSDLIERQAALDILYDFAGCIVDTPNGYYSKAYKACRHRLETLPPARQTVGDWIMTKELDEDVATCPFCGAEMRRKSNGEKPEPPNFCSKCGANLRGEQNG